MNSKEIKLTFTCDIVTFHQELVKNADLMEAIVIELNKKLVDKGLTGNHCLRLEGLTG